MSWNLSPSDTSQDKVNTAIVNQISVDGVFVKVLPAGSSPNVVYRVGDGTVHPEGWDNVLDNNYIDFYISTGATGTQGVQGNDGASAYSQAVSGGYNGTEDEFYALLTQTSDNGILAAESAAAALVSENNASASALASSNSASASAASAVTSANSATASNNSALASEASSVSSSGFADASSTSASSALNSANSATNSANTATAQAIIATDNAVISTSKLSSFNSQYISSLTTPSTPITGMLWFDLNVDLLKVYNGTSWELAGTTVNGTAKRQSFTATASQTVFPITGGYDAGFADVYMNGVKLLNGVDVDVSSGTNVVLTVGATVGNIIDVVAYGAFVLADTYTQAEIDAKDTVLQGNIDLKANITNPILIGLSETKIAMPADDIDLATGNLFTKTISTATTLTVSNVVATGSVNSFILELTNAGSAVITYPAGVKWASGTAPTLTASGVDILGFYTHDAGTTWRGIILAKDSK